jgi:NADPH:quinone reductase-like Zn-dependent oxidoreductase
MARRGDRRSERFEATGGRLRLTVGREELVPAIGDAVTVPKGTPPTFAVEGAEPVGLVATFDPAGAMEAFFAELHRLVRDGHIDARGRPRSLAVAPFALSHLDEFRPACAPGRLQRGVLATLARGFRVRARGYVVAVRAIAVREWGGRDKLELLDLEPPPVAPDGVLVRIRAAGLNPVDYKVREGRLAGAFPFHFPVVLGWDAAGVVERVGPAVTWFKPGDPVYGYCRRHDLQYGTYAEYTTVPEGYLAHMPPELSFEQAGALPLAVLTAHQAIERSGLRHGETVFVPAGAGGVGHLAIQLAVERGARVIATASPPNHSFLRELGAEPLDYRDPDLVAKVHECAEADGPDAALDPLGGDSREQAFAALRRGGRIVSIASPAPEPREGYEVHYIFVRPSGYDLGEHVTPLVQEGRLRPDVEETYPLERASEAMERLEEGHVRGKLVLTIE